jgi:hypothetical protein
MGCGQNLDNRGVAVVESGMRVSETGVARTVMRLREDIL